MITIKLLHGLLIGWWFANFEPLQGFITKYIKPHIPLKLSYISSALSCFKCLSFWATLTITQDIYQAILAAIIAFTYDKLMNSLRMFL